MLIKKEKHTDVERIGATGAQRPPSPCIQLCTLDDENRCVGCGRTLAQISAWSLMTADEQWRLIDELAARKAANEATIAAENGE
jgi:predicted Fe-S protein YdhL (DUF1289 family)